MHLYGTKVSAYILVMRSFGCLENVHINRNFGVTIDNWYCKKDEL